MLRLPRQAPSLYLLKFSPCSLFTAASAAARRATTSAQKRLFVNEADPDPSPLLATIYILAKLASDKEKERKIVDSVPK